MLCQSFFEGFVFRVFVMEKRHGFFCANTFSDLPVSVYINVGIFRNSSHILGHEIKSRSDTIDVKITYCK